MTPASGSGVDDLLMSNVYRFDGERQELVEKIIRLTGENRLLERSLRELVAEPEMASHVVALTARIVELEELCATLNQRIGRRSA